MPLPTSKDKTHTPGDPISAQLIDKLQDCVVNKSHGVVRSKYRVNGRTVVTGTWAVSQDGLISESANLQECRVYFDPPEVGSIITAAFAKVADVAGSLVAFSLLRLEDISPGLVNVFTIHGPFNSGGTGAIHTIGGALATPHQISDTYRYGVRFSTEGGGASTRRVYEIKLDWSRP